MNTFDENKVNRQSAGTSAGGQFAAKSHPADDHVGLSPEKDWESWEADVFTRAAQGEVTAEEVEWATQQGHLSRRRARRIEALSGRLDRDEVGRMWAQGNIGKSEWIDLVNLQPGTRGHREHQPMPQVSARLREVGFDADVATLGYREAARADAQDHEGDGAGSFFPPGEEDWAERQIIDFANENADDLHTLMTEGDYRSSQLGYDLWVTRNGVDLWSSSASQGDAGIWDSKHGDAGERLTSNAMALGEEHVYTDEAGNLAFE